MRTEDFRDALQRLRISGLSASPWQDGRLGTLKLMLLPEFHRHKARKSHRRRILLTEVLSHCSGVGLRLALASHARPARARRSASRWGGDAPCLAATTRVNDIVS
eukprot:6199546-Pleurochrysis_carterae.AAC.4